jgi:hypothetical protein
VEGGRGLRPRRARRDSSPTSCSAWSTGLLARVDQDWRDLEALLALGSETARAAVVDQLRNGRLEQRLQAARLLEDDKALVPDIEAAAIAGLESALLFYGLSIALDLATKPSHAALVDALFRAALGTKVRPPSMPPRAGVHHGKAKRSSTGSSGRSSCASTRRIVPSERWPSASYAPCAGSIRSPTSRAGHEKAPPGDAGRGPCEQISGRRRRSRRCRLTTELNTEVVALSKRGPNMYVRPL